MTLPGSFVIFLYFLTDWHDYCYIRVMERKQELKKQIKKWEKRYNKLWNAGLPFEEWREKAEKMHKEAIPIYGELHMITDEYELHDHLNFGKLMPLEKFIGCCECKGFMDSDGEGYYSTKDKESSICAVPSEICAGYIRKDFEYVKWYNK